LWIANLVVLEQGGISQGIVTNVLKRQKTSTDLRTLRKKTITQISLEKYLVARSRGRECPFPKREDPNLQSSATPPGSQKTERAVGSVSKGT